MVKYIKCPRCELNYIDSEKQEYCDVCIAELKGKRLQFADLEDEDFEEVDEALDSEELCPVCGVNRIRQGEKMCDACKAQQEYEDDVDIENDEEWKNYLEEDDGDLTVDEELQEEIEEEFANNGEEEEYNNDDDFYESEDVDSLSDLEDDEYDDDDDEEDDEDDDF